MTASRLDAVTFDVSDPTTTAAFWAALLGREVVDEPDATLVPGGGTQTGLRFVRSASTQVGRPWLHLHLTSTGPDDQRHTVESALCLDGRRLDVGQSVDDAFVVLSDPGGNELCVIEPDNAFLYGTGRLGEVTCDGSREVGRFWRDVLGWCQVWDEGAQTAIQSPLGGTKISWDAWGRPAAPDAASRQWFDLVTADLKTKVERLISLGATLVAQQSDRVEMADPDGRAFRLRQR